MVGLQEEVIPHKHFNLYITALQPSAAGRFLNKKLKFHKFVIHKFVKLRQLYVADPVFTLWFKRRFL